MEQRERGEWEREVKEKKGMDPEEGEAEQAEGRVQGGGGVKREVHPRKQLMREKAAPGPVPHCLLASEQLTVFIFFK